MSEHTAMRDRLERLLDTMGPASAYQAERAQELVDGLSEAGYTRWLRCVVEVQERGLFQTEDLQDHDRRGWLTLPQDVKDILVLAADVIGGARLSQAQASLLAELQQERPLGPDPALDLHDLRLLAELAEARALDECGRQHQPIPQQPRTKTETPPPDLPDEFKWDRRRWPRMWGM